MLLTQLKMQKNKGCSITVCSCSSYEGIMNRNELIKLVSALKNAHFEVTVIPDLCKTAISDAAQMAAIATTTVIACYPRAVKSIFSNVGLKPQQIFDIRNHRSEEILSEMGISQPVVTSNPSFSALVPDCCECTTERACPAWYPVIDRERCTKCGKCHDFCLFGVYAMNEGTVNVANPQNCKDDCPACARVCPSKAIIFPKYKKSPINGGLLDEEQFGETETKMLYDIALKRKLKERRAKVSLFKN